MAGANNEILSFQFAIRTPRALPAPALRVTEFRTTTGPPWAFPVELFRMHAVDVRTFPGWHIRSLPPNLRNHSAMDILVPVAAPQGGIPPSLAANQAYVVWADMTVPKGTNEGLYTGSVELSSSGLLVGTIPIEVTVWPFVLPDDCRPPLIAQFDHAAWVRDYAAAVGDSSINAHHWHDHPRSADITAALHSALSMLQRHRISPILPALAPRASMSARSEITLDWRQFDEVLAPVMNGTVFDNRLPSPAIIVPVPDSVQNNAARPGGDLVLRDYFSRAAAHFQQMGWIDRAFAVTPAGVLGASASVREAARDSAELISTGTAGAVRVASPLIPQDMREYGWYEFPHTDLDDVVDIWFPPAQFFDPAGDRRGEFWFTVDRPPYSGTTTVHASPADVRSIPWQARSVRAAAIYVPAVNPWPADAASAPACIAANPGTLLYPGREFGLAAPVPSARLKHLRRGMQDAAYLRLLEDHGLDHVARAVVGALISAVGTSAYRAHFADGQPPGWKSDIAAYDLAREIMAGELVKSAYGQRAAGREDFARSAAWLRLMDEGRRVRLRPEGVRVRPLGSARDPQAELHLTATVQNGSRVPLSGRINVPHSLPFEAAELAELRPGADQALRLPARENLRRLFSQGTRSLAVELSVESGKRWTSTVRLALATAIPVAAPVRIDGDLSDWPVGSGNVLSDFQSVALPEDSTQSRAPRYATSAFVMRDDLAVYFAIRCEASEAHARPPARKRVVYDDMVPLGEDLIEILLDPDNLGTRDPADLYHLTVKRSGADLAEKGFSFDPPWCRRENWAADIDVAVIDSGRQWTAELRIPLDAFSPGPRRNEIWGLNVTRFDPANQEFSNWSGAGGNAYDPLSLGNLYLP